MSDQEENKRLRERVALLEQQLQQEKEETRETTLPEYLDLSHEYLSESITIQTNKSLSTKGDPSNAKGKFHPNLLKP